MLTLFIGNSYTYCNGGKTLEWHWYNPDTLDAIGERKWDTIVLREMAWASVREFGEEGGVA